MTIPPAMRERLKDLIPAGLPAERRPNDQPGCGQPTTREIPLTQGKVSWIDADDFASVSARSHLETVHDGGKDP